MIREHIIKLMCNEDVNQLTLGGGKDPETFASYPHDECSFD